MRVPCNGLCPIDISQDQADFVVTIDSIGDPKGKTSSQHLALPFDLFAKADGGHDLEHTRGDRPDRDLEKQRERGHTRCEETQDTDADA